jgi:simple sugar transport system ATP-binding protein
MAIIMISDEIQEILDNCNRVLIMSKGKLVKEIEDAGKISPDEVFAIISNGSANEVAP